MVKASILVAMFIIFSNDEILFILWRTHLLQWHVVIDMVAPAMWKCLFSPQPRLDSRIWIFKRRILTECILVIINCHIPIMFKDIVLETNWNEHHTLLYMIRKTKNAWISINQNAKAFFAYPTCIPPVSRKKKKKKNSAEPQTRNFALILSVNFALNSILLLLALLSAMRLEQSWSWPASLPTTANLFQALTKAAAHLSAESANDDHVAPVCIASVS